MTKPLWEPSTQKDVAGNSWTASQLLRRPGLLGLQAEYLAVEPEQIDDTIDIVAFACGDPVTCGQQTVPTTVLTYQADFVSSTQGLWYVAAPYIAFSSGSIVLEGHAVGLLYGSNVNVKGDYRLSTSDSPIPSEAGAGEGYIDLSGAFELSSGPLSVTWQITLVNASLTDPSAPGPNFFYAAYLGPVLNSVV